jgi:hypothetical protein
MIPDHLKTFFWDVDVDTFQPEAHPDYTIFRVLEYGDVEEIAWLRQTFPEAEIHRVLRAETRLSEKSANFWALVYEVPFHEVAVLNRSRQHDEAASNGSEIY